MYLKIIDKNILIRLHHNELQSLHDMAKTLNLSRTCIRNNMKNYGIKILSINERFILKYRNVKIGKLTLIDLKQVNNKGYYKCHCRCECGETYITIKSTYLKGVACGCVREHRTSEYGMGKKNQWLSNYRWRSFKNFAKQRNYKFNISQQFAYDLFIKQNKICNYSGEVLILDNFVSKINTASLDRIDSDKDYTEDNIQWIHKDINHMKWDYSEDYFLKTVYEIANYRINRNFQQSTNNYSIYNTVINKEIWYSMRTAQNLKIKKNKFLEINISNKELLNKLNLQQNRCIYSNRLLIMNEKFRTASLDRIDSSKGYIVNNIQWVDKSINKMKSNFKEETFLKWIDKIYKYKNLEKYYN